MIDKIKDFIFTGGKHFNEKAEAIEYMNKNNAHYELYKAKSGAEVNKTVASLNINNDLVSSIRKATERGVIGKRVNIQSRTPYDKFNSDFEREIAIWSKRGNCEITGRYYRGLIERSIIGYEKTQGGVIIRHHTNSNWAIPYKIELVPLSMIDTSKDNILENEVNGLKINDFGEITGIYIYKDILRTESTLVPYSELTLYVVPFVDPTQYSGVSPLAPIIATLDMITTYGVAEIRSAKQRAEGAIIIKTSLFEEILKIKQQNAKATGAGRISETELFDLYKHFKINGSLDGANYIPKDDEVENLNKNTDSIYEKLDENSKRTVSSGAGLSTQTTFREMPSSYNSALLNAQLDNSEFEIIFEDFIELVWREVIEVRLLNALVMAGRLKPIGYWSNPDRYRNVEFIRKSVAHIDPSKVEKSISEGLANGTLNHIDELAKKGVDWKEHIKKESEFRKVWKEELGNENEVDDNED